MLATLSIEVDRAKLGSGKQTMLELVFNARASFGKFGNILALKTF